MKCERAEDCSEVDVPAYSVGVQHVLPLTEDEQEEAARSKLSTLTEPAGPECFNCGETGHGLKECPLPKDRNRIQAARDASARRNMRYHEDGKAPMQRQQIESLREAYPMVVAGQLSMGLRVALGMTAAASSAAAAASTAPTSSASVADPALRQQQDFASSSPDVEPPFASRMRRFGYPPAYLQPIPDQSNCTHHGYATNGDVSWLISRFDGDYTSSKNASMPSVEAVNAAKAQEVSAAEAREAADAEGAAKLVWFDTAEAVDEYFDAAIAAEDEEEGMLGTADAADNDLDRGGSGAGAADELMRADGDGNADAAGLLRSSPPSSASLLPGLQAASPAQAAAAPQPPARVRGLSAAPLTAPLRLTPFFPCCTCNRRRLVHFSWLDPDGDTCPVHVGSLRIDDNDDGGTHATVSAPAAPQQKQQYVLISTKPSHSPSPSSRSRWGGAVPSAAPTPTARDAHSTVAGVTSTAQLRHGPVVVPAATSASAAASGNMDGDFGVAMDISGAYANTNFDSPTPTAAACHHVNVNGDAASAAGHSYRSHAPPKAPLQLPPTQSAAMPVPVPASTDVEEGELEQDMEF